MAQRAHYPSPVPIDAYGNGGFRFAQMRHSGSLLMLPSGVHEWTANDQSALTPKDFDMVFAEVDAVEFLLLGTGSRLARPSPEVRGAFDAAGIGLDIMDTGATCRTFNVLLAESRAVAAALIAVP